MIPNLRSTQAVPFGSPSDQSDFYHILQAHYAPHIQEDPRPTPYAPGPISALLSAVKCTPRDLVSEPQFETPATPPQEDSSLARTVPAPHPTDIFLYHPFGKWAWLGRRSIVDVGIGVNLTAVKQASLSLELGKVQDRRFPYIRKSWSRSSPLDGFFCELALYRGQLRSLQGTVVPRLIGAYALRDSLRLAMDVPHHSFFIEAAADMPDVLKRRCIAAYSKLHAQGVRHGDVRLSNILIGGDANVTLINFHKSTALIPNEDVHLAAATPEDLRDEMRCVRYLLNYQGAREIETRLAMQYLSVRQTPQFKMAASNLLEFAQWGEDLLDLPFDLDDIRYQPVRYCTPNQPKPDLVREIRAFIDLVNSFETASGPEPLPGAPLPPQPPRGSFSLVRKRKGPTDDHDGSSKELHWELSETFGHSDKTPLLDDALPIASSSKSTSTEHRQSRRMSWIPAADVPLVPVLTTPPPSPPKDDLDCNSYQSPSPPQEAVSSLSQPVPDNQALLAQRGDHLRKARKLNKFFRRMSASGNAAHWERQAILQRENNLYLAQPVPDDWPSTIKFTSPEATVFQEGQEQHELDSASDVSSSNHMSAPTPLSPVRSQAKRKRDETDLDPLGPPTPPRKKSKPSTKPHSIIKGILKKSNSSRSSKTSITSVFKEDSSIFQLHRRLRDFGEPGPRKRPPTRPQLIHEAPSLSTRCIEIPGQAAAEATYPVLEWIRGFLGVFT